MSSIDESKNFIPLNIAVLTISDTRTLADDKSGTTLADRLAAAGHKLAAREIVVDDVDAIRTIVKRWIADPGIDVIITHRRHRFHRPRRDAGGDRAVVRKADGRLLDRVPHAEPRQDRHLDDPEPRHRRCRRRHLYLLPAGIAGRLPRCVGRHSGGATRLPHAALQLRRNHAAVGRTSAAGEGARRDGLATHHSGARVSANPKSRDSGFDASHRPGMTGTSYSSISQVSPIRSWPKLRCGSLATSTKPAS